MLSSCVHHRCSHLYLSCKGNCWRDSCSQAIAKFGSLRFQMLLHSNRRRPCKLTSIQWRLFQSHSTSNESRTTKSTIETRNNHQVEKPEPHDSLKSSALHDSQSSPQSFADRVFSASKRTLSSASKSAVSLLSQGLSKASVSAKVVGSRVLESAMLRRDALIQSVKETAAAFTESLQTKAIAIFLSTKSKISASLRSLPSKIIQGIRNQVQQGVSRLFQIVDTNLIQVIGTTRESAGRWLWWWSLAAVGVYGISTTVPKELIRVAFEERKVNGTTTRDNNSQQ